LRKLGNNFTFVVVTDRDDLDGQIYKKFARTGTVTEDVKEVRADSGEHLKQLLTENGDVRVEKCKGPMEDARKLLCAAIGMT
jgi:type I site-specific restriction-modification system R (restriction) subunit